MRVLEIMGSLHRGGAETMIMNYYKAFDKELCQMDFVIHAKFDDDYCEEASLMGANIIYIERPGKVGALKYIRLLSEAIKQNGPYDAVHIHTNYQAFLGIISARLAGVKKIIVHSHSTVFPKGTILINRMIMKLFNVIRIGCGEEAGRAFFGKEKFIIINNAIDVSKFKSTSGKNFEEIKRKRFGSHIVIGHIGRFHPQKNHDFLIELMRKMKDINDNIILALYGEGDREEEIKKKVEENGLKENVWFMGLTNDVVTAYQTFDIFILPSLYEGFPVTLVESQLSGIRSLTSKNVSRECDLELGLLEFLPLDVNVWTKKIEEYVKESIKSNRVQEKETFDQYDVNIQWKRLFEIYRS